MSKVIPSSGLPSKNPVFHPPLLPSMRVLTHPPIHSYLHALPYLYIETSNPDRTKGCTPPLDVQLDHSQPHTRLETCFSKCILFKWLCSPRCFQGFGQLTLLQHPPSSSFSLFSNFSIRDSTLS